MEESITNGCCLTYVPNPKHKKPWQPGRKGALCPAWSHDLAQKLLTGSEAHPQSGKKVRFATHNGLAFAAYPDNQGGWHGYPIGWNEVPDKIRNNWLKEKLISRRDVRKYDFLQVDDKGQLVD
ncbi:MAG: hypothetical protein HQL57_00075 [Magnetococcales bacterium]|nr:hypothetical protein [Magnetococcales bacterium]MBF0155569.1 hypothetical protein [Magnetococcales bacterium]